MTLKLKVKQSKHKIRLHMASFKTEILLYYTEEKRLRYKFHNQHIRHLIKHTMTVICNIIWSVLATNGWCWECLWYKCLICIFEWITHSLTSFMYTHALTCKSMLKIIMAEAFWVSFCWSLLVSIGLVEKSLG